MIRLLSSVVALLALGPAAASNQPLAFDDLKSSYSDVSEVRFWLRNAGPVRLYLDSFCPDRVWLERLGGDGTSWVPREMWCCANAGAGSPQSLPPGGSVKLRVRIVPELPGRYRIRGRYSVELWGSIVEIPENIETVTSPVFDVEYRRVIGPGRAPAAAEAWRLGGRE